MGRDWGIGIGDSQQRFAADGTREGAAFATPDSGLPNPGAIGAYLHQHESKPLLRLITCGSVDDGKSTLIGRLLYDSKRLFDDQLAALEGDSRRHGTQGEGIDYALLMDGLAAERSGTAAAEGATARNRSGPIPSAVQLWRDRPMPAPKGHGTQAGQAPCRVFKLSGKRTEGHEEDRRCGRS